MTNETAAPHACPTATPASTARVAVIRPPTPASASVASSATSAPANAATGSGTATPSTSTATAPSEAPEEMPSRYGSASGLRVTACSTTPQSASPAPTSTAVSARGARPCQMIASRIGDSEFSGTVTGRPSSAIQARRWCHADCTTCTGVIGSGPTTDAGPITSASTTEATSTTHPTSSHGTRDDARPGAALVGCVAAGASSRLVMAAGSCRRQLSELVGERGDGVDVADARLGRRESRRRGTAPPVPREAWR